MEGGCVTFTEVLYTGDVYDDQVRWGGGDDPRERLVPGEIYSVRAVEVHSFHTKLDILGWKFNSVFFRQPNGERLNLEPYFEAWRRERGRGCS